MSSGTGAMGILSVLLAAVVGQEALAASSTVSFSFNRTADLEPSHRLCALLPFWRALEITPDSMPPRELLREHE